MSEGISQSEYQNEVEEQANYLSDAAVDALEDGDYDEYREAVYELVSDVLDHHNWFARSYHGPADHGAIIEYATEEDVDVSRQRDISWVGDSEDPEKIIKQLAYMAFETHVIETAFERARGGV